jgi:hypothetical protein
MKKVRGTWKICLLEMPSIHKTIKLHKTKMYGKYVYYKGKLSRDVKICSSDIHER